MKLSYVVGTMLMCSLTLGACATLDEQSNPGTERITVLVSPKSKVRFSSIEFSERNSTVNIPEDVKQLFCENLNEFLYKKVGFQKGNDLKIQYRFIQYSPANLLQEERSLMVEAKYLDVGDQEIAVVRIEGKIGFGLGSLNGPLWRCAREIAEYAKRNFK